MKMTTSMKSVRLPIVKLLQKAKINKIVHKVYYNYFHGFKTANTDVLPAVEKCLKKAQELGTINQGDYYEFGIFKGYTFWYVQDLVKKQILNSNMRFFGFDSFKGLPKVKGRDKTSSNDFYEGQYSCSKEQVLKNLQSKGIDKKRTFLVEGFFEDSLTKETKKQHQMDKLAIALIDCDLYSSTVEVLNFIEDMLVENTILIFDDWNCFDKDDEKGQRKAFREFLEANRQFSVEEFFSYGLYGQAFILKL